MQASLSYVLKFLYTSTHIHENQDFLKESHCISNSFQRNIFPESFLISLYPVEFSSTCMYIVGDGEANMYICL